MAFFPRRTIAGLGVALFASATACSLVLGLRDGTLGSDAGVGTDGQTGDAATDVDPNPEKDVVTVDVDNAFCGDAARYRSPDAIYVDPVGGADIGNCGPDTQPCKSLKQALTQVKLKNPKVIYLGKGTYQEQVTLTQIENGLTIEGGWGPGWTSECQASLATVIDPRSKNDPSGAPTIHVNNANNVTLRLFTVWSRNQGYTGTAVSAVWVTGSSNAVSFDNMTLVARYGGDGTIGSPGGTAFSFCGADSGAAGGPGAPGGPGSWGPNGFAYDTGGTGETGHEGTAGGAGESSVDVSCYGNCLAYPGCGVGGPVTTSTGGGGSPGCGGPPGTGGTGGGGGGASAALFVWGSKVSLSGGTTLLTVLGGQGGAGGPGGPGDAGRPGTDGLPDNNCLQSCTAVDGGFNDAGGFCSQNRPPVPGGKGGDAGGPGGNGGQGGGGHGGPSYLVAYGGNGSVVVEAGILTVSTVGDGGPGGAPNGAAGETEKVKTLP